MIKDRKNRFPNNSIGANEWGRALLLAENRETNAAKDFLIDCMACHQPARRTDWVCTQVYPRLILAAAVPPPLCRCGELTPRNGSSQRTFSGTRK